MFSPKGFLVRAVVIALAFLIVHALGFREHTTLISGTADFHSFASRLRIVLGCMYIILYLMAVMVAPVLAVASGIFTGLLRRGAASPDDST